MAPSLISLRVQAEPLELRPHKWSLRAPSAGGGDADSDPQIMYNKKNQTEKT